MDIKMDNLWKKWRDHYNNLGLEVDKISVDGLIHDEQYNRIKSILFILKETNDYTGSLQGLLKNGPKYQMWHTLSRWAAGILEDFPEYKKIDDSNILKQSLHQVSAINLKKTTGGTRAEYSIVNAFAHQDRFLLKEQIELIAPKIIVACGTFDILVWLLGLTVDAQEPHKKAAITPNGVKIIPMRHPSMADNRKTYSALKTFFR